MQKPIPRSHPISEELLDEELQLLQKVVVIRRSHLKSIDELARLDALHKQKAKCPTKKYRYRDTKEAVKVLHSIANSRQRAAEEGRTYHFRQIGQYKCACKAVHLTSKTRNKGALLVA